MEPLHSTMHHDQLQLATTSPAIVFEAVLSPLHFHGLRAHEATCTSALCGVQACHACAHLQRPAVLAAAVRLLLPRCWRQRLLAAAVPLLAAATRSAAGGGGNRQQQQQQQPSPSPALVTAALVTATMATAAMATAAMARATAPARARQAARRRHSPRRAFGRVGWGVAACGNGTAFLRRDANFACPARTDRG